MAAGLVAFALLAGVTESGWTQAVISNSSNSVATGALSFTHSACPGAASPCTGNALSTSPTVASPGVSVSDTITNNSPYAPGSLTQTVRVASCGTVQLASTGSTTSDSMLPRYATTFRVSDKWGGTNAATFNGTSAYAADVGGTSDGGLLGSSYAIGVWFKVASGYSAGGALIGLQPGATTATSGTATLALWMTSMGTIRYRIPTLTGTATGVSTSTYNDGNWHLAVLSVSLVLATSTPTLYVDNTTNTASGYTFKLLGTTGYWHLGYADLAGATGAPTSMYLAGSLSGAFVANSTVNGATVSAASTSAAAYQSALSSPTLFWMLGDSGTTTYTGSQPIIGSTSPCTMVDLNLTVAGAAVNSPPTSLSAWFTHGVYTVTAPTASGGTTSSVAQTYRDSTYNTYVSGLYLYAPLVWAVTLTGTAWTVSFSWTTTSALVVA